MLSSNRFSPEKMGVISFSCSISFVFYFFISFVVLILFKKAIYNDLGNQLLLFGCDPDEPYSSFYCHNIFESHNISENKSVFGLTVVSAVIFPISILLGVVSRLLGFNWLPDSDVRRFHIKLSITSFINSLLSIAFIFLFMHFVFPRCFPMSDESSSTIDTLNSRYLKDKGEITSYFVGGFFILAQLISMFYVVSVESCSLSCVRRADATERQGLLADTGRVNDERTCFQKAASFFGLNSSGNRPRIRRPDEEMDTLGINLPPVASARAGGAALP